MAFMPKNMKNWPIYVKNNKCKGLLVNIVKPIYIIKIAKRYTYYDIINILIKNKKLIKDIDEVDQISQEKKYFYKYLIYYAWMINKNIQKAFNAFAAGGITLGATILWSLSDSLAFIACGILFWGLVKLAQGTVEVV